MYLNVHMITVWLFAAPEYPSLRSGAIFTLIISNHRFLRPVTMNYFKLIEPYLYGSLSPEEQLVFERQLARNPALANETSLRFSLVRVLIASPGYPFHPTFKPLNGPGTEAARRSGIFEWLWLACTATVLGGILLGYLLY